MTDRSQWKKVNVGFKLFPPILKSAAGRPRNRRIKGVEKGGSGKRKHKCKRCGQFGHIMKTCNEPVDDPSAPPPAPPKPKRKRIRKVVVKSDPLDVVEQSSGNLGTTSRGIASANLGTPSREIASDVTQTGPTTRSRARALNLDVAGPSTKQHSEQDI